MDKSQIIELILAQKLHLLLPQMSKDFLSSVLCLHREKLTEAKYILAQTHHLKKLSSTQQTIKLAYIFTSAANSNIKGYV